MRVERRNDYMRRELVDYMQSQVDINGIMSGAYDRPLAVLHSMRAGIVFERFGVDGAERLEKLVDFDIKVGREGRVWKELIYCKELNPKNIDELIAKYSESDRNSVAMDMNAWMSERVEDYERCVGQYNRALMISWGKIMLGNIGEIKRLNYSDEDVSDSLIEMELKITKYVKQMEAGK